MLMQVQDLLGAKWDLWLSQNYARRREAEHHDQDMIQLLRNVPTLKLLTQTQLEGLLSDFALEKFNEGDMIIEEGEGGDKYYVIKAGAVIVAIEDGATGENKQVATMQRGDQFGERALITDEPRAASIFAAEDGVEVLSLTREAFEDKLGGFKELMEQEVLRKETEAVVKHRTITLWLSPHLRAPPRPLFFHPPAVPAHRTSSWTGMTGGPKVGGGGSWPPA